MEIVNILKEFLPRRELFYHEEHEGHEEKHRGKWGVNDEESCGIEHEDLSYVEMTNCKLKIKDAQTSCPSCSSW